MTIGQKLRFYRERVDFSQAAVARRLHCDRSTYSYYELDRTEPDLLRIWEICAILKTDPGHVLNPDFDPEEDRIRKYQERLRQQKKTRLQRSAAERMNIPMIEDLQRSADRFFAG